MCANLPTAAIICGKDDGFVPDNDGTREASFDKPKARGCEIVKPYAGMSYAVDELTFNMFYIQAEW